MKLKNDALQELYDTLTYGPILSSPYTESPIDRAFKECDEKLSESATFAHIKALEDRCNVLERSNKALRDDNDKLGDKVIGLNKKNEKLEKDIDAKTKENAALISANADLSNKVVDIKKRITELQKKGDDLSKKAVALQEELDRKMASRKHLRRLYVGEGARKLWDMLQNVNDSQPNEFDVKCEGMEDVVGMDLDDFLDAYKKWQEQKEQNRLNNMRYYLAEFCEGKVCESCPLGSLKYKCGCGYSFKRRDRFDTRIIPDEDIKRYYEKARGCGRYTLKNATFYFDNKPYTMEAKVEINKDLLEKVCGIKPEEEEHKLEYGDAVRLVWRNYDYMYIGPYEKEPTLVRMFDPKNHAIVTSHIANVRYNGGKIVLTSEDDLRMIWKDKK